MARFARVPLAAALLVAIAAPSVNAALTPSTNQEIKAERRTFAFINVYRVDQGLDELTNHAYITREARKHSNYMANHGVLSHDGFTNRKNRIAGQDSGIDSTKICEATAKALGVKDPVVVARRAVRAWKASPSLRRCLLDTPFTKQSAGVGAERRNDTWYLTFIAANDTSP
jgi:uncharacterized protein YkwD